MTVRMNISGLTVDPMTNSPILILKEKDGDQVIPIWIGLLEATAIASELEKVHFSRPMTHDLYKNTTELLGARVSRIEICDLKDNTYYALIHFEFQDKTLEIDARPSDAIAIALRAEAPIFVNEIVFEKSKNMEPKFKESIGGEEGKKWTEILEGLDPDDFGKYKM